MMEVGDHASQPCVVRRTTEIVIGMVSSIEPQLSLGMTDESRTELAWYPSVFCHVLPCHEHASPHCHEPHIHAFQKLSEAFV
jgi:hypothetical protein